MNKIKNDYRLHNIKKKWNNIFMNAKKIQNN